MLGWPRDQNQVPVQTVPDHSITEPYAQARAQMVLEQLIPRGIDAPAVLEAMQQVPRERFLAAPLIPRAYQDGPLPTAAGQTISQPYIVAASAQHAALRASDRVLEIGTGSGYSTAVLSLCCREVYSVERLPALAQSATERLSQLGYTRCHVRCADGSLGWREKAPFDAIIVAAAGPAVPEALLDQLAIGGRLVMPVGPRDDTQELRKVTRRNATTLEYETLFPVRFVRLVGEQAWSDSDAGR